MNSGFYAACAGLLARTDALEVAANNLANINTNGYKGQREFFRSLLLANANGGTLNSAINDFGVLGGAGLNLAAGNLERTGNDLDLAIEGSAFFVVQTKAGLRYTRNGNFKSSPTGQLLTAEGDPVLGEQGAIRVPTGPLSVSTDGTISSAGAVVAKLRLVELSADSVKAEGRTLFSAPKAAERPAKSSSVRQGMLEASNVNPVGATVGLIAIQRHAELLQRALQTFHTEFNRSAVEELPKI